MTRERRESRLRGSFVPATDVATAFGGNAVNAIGTLKIDGTGGVLAPLLPRATFAVSGKTIGTLRDQRR